MGVRQLAVIAMAACGIAVSANAASASSDEAWETFRASVEATCLKAADPLFRLATVRVDPFGSESYGLALLSGKAEGSDAEIAAICVYDKKTGAVEIGGELPE